MVLNGLTLTNTDPGIIFNNPGNQQLAIGDTLTLPLVNPNNMDITWATSQLPTGIYVSGYTNTSISFISSQNITSTVIYITAISGNFMYTINFKIGVISTTFTTLILSSIVGLSLFLNFGGVSAISGDGNTIVVGYNGHNALNGYVGVYKYSSGSWNTATSLTIAQSGTTTTQLGTSVAISTDGTTIVGCSYNGWIGVWKYSNNAWNVATQLIHTNNKARAVAITPDGNTVVLGGAYYLSGLYGYVGVWTYSNNSWSSVTNLSIPTSNTQAGISIAISADGNTIVAGDTAYNSSQGQLLVWKYTNNSWGSYTTIRNSNLMVNAQLGTAVSINNDGTIIAASAPGDNWIGVWYYTNNTWGTPTQMPSTGLTHNSLGNAITMNKDGNIIIATEKSNSRLIIWTYANGWKYQTVLTNGAVLGTANLGNSVSMNDNNTIIISNTNTYEFTSVWYI